MIVESEALFSIWLADYAIHNTYLSEELHICLRWAVTV
jgi:hypothetical protein